MWWWLALTAAATEIRGMTVSTPTWGWEWGTERMDATLDVLRSDGVNWVAIHPYARIASDGRVSFRDIDPEHPPEWLTRPVREAHARGMKILVVPHLAYWGSGFSWRGAVTFPDDAERARFFADYQRFLLAVATAVPDADALAIGSELDGTVGDEVAWRHLIGSVRAEWHGPITYAANWDRVDDVPFWDAVDAIGVQAYFPLVAPGGSSDRAALDAGWDRVLSRMRALSERTGKHVVFTELGYDAGPDPAVEPWRSGGGSQGDPLQATCLQAALEALDREPAVIGAFLWKWFPGEEQHGDFRMSAPELQAVIRRRWAGP